MRIESAEFKKIIDLAYSAHQEHNNKAEFRQGGTVPFVVHPFWCAMMLLHEIKVPIEQRQIGYQALLLHDVLEDTTLELPADLSEEVKRAVEAMTFETWQQEKEAVIKMPPFLKLLKLYDKVASIYDEGVSAHKENGQKRQQWRRLTESLIEDVEKHYGKLRITSVARSVIADTNW